MEAADLSNEVQPQAGQQTQSWSTTRDGRDLDTSGNAKKFLTTHGWRIAKPAEKAGRFGGRQVGVDDWSSFSVFVCWSVWLCCFSGGEGVACSCQKFLQNDLALRPPRTPTPTPRAQNLKKSFQK
uniref:Uncharacterized protein n=1 Tax=Chromera velia CCMP2878 TaxID=1169474 RepID=A0A0K6S6L5_9ALVE|eukprot:Cvel_17392.t1-p1 / transcript=Cvel_17392.t1 / gene=Cvel_17392 / organism=Chromera_velia_CCMP2878 / gene_product=hypothetical protein / transcript_product=hypothetical protein / location=Cvel_scaffold1384:16333-18909(-) / protein_length=124 / sequence_SO=supercontig / SO=protein_coding / is_pseudo=false